MQLIIEFFFSYPMHEKSHTIIWIPVLLRNEQQVYFHIDNPTKVSFRAELRNTELIAWSRLNKDSIKEKKTLLHISRISNLCFWKSGTNLEARQNFNVCFIDRIWRYPLRLFLLLLKIWGHIRTLLTYSTEDTEDDIEGYHSLFTENFNWDNFFFHISANV